MGRALPLAAACVVLAAALRTWRPRAPAPAGPPVPRQRGCAGRDDRGDHRNRHPSVNDVCRTLAQAAVDNELPRSSSHASSDRRAARPSAVGPAGAQASRRSCRGPPRCAGSPTPSIRCRRCARRRLPSRAAPTFRGNLGLAAAAYNAGPGPVEAWLAERRGLPAETQAFMMIVTGYAARPGLRNRRRSSRPRPRRPRPRNRRALREIAGR